MWEGPNYFRIHADNSLQNYNWSVIKNSDFFLSREWFQEINFVTTGKA